jgi:hypothetical protein
MRFIVSLPHEQWARLREMADTERRRPQDEAAILLAHALTRDRQVYADQAPLAPGARAPSSHPRRAPSRNVGERLVSH